MIVVGNHNECDINNKFNDDAYARAQYFQSDDYAGAVDFVYRQIRIMFKDKLELSKHYKFDCNYGMQEIRKINEDASNLDYEDYYDLATFYDNDENYFCDAVIIDGKFGLRYSIKHSEDEYDNLHFEECDLNLENEITLMLSMQEKLSKFIDSELEYSIQMNNSNIKI